MRRLTLILSDLYLPAEASLENLPAPAALPGLDWLLRFAQATSLADDWRQWLLLELGLHSLAGQSVAAMAARAWLTPDLAATAWLATPVRLEARLDHVRLVDRGLLRLTFAERQSLMVEFAESFGPGYSLHDAGPRGFVLAGVQAARVATVDPARLLDADIGHAVPHGAQARELRRLGSELDMWLHRSALNDAREHAGLPRISSLWLWGGGTGEIGAPAQSASSVSAALYGEDPALAGLALATTQRLLQPPPAALAGFASEVEHAVVELTPMSGANGAGLASLESAWFVPLRAALSRGEWSVVELVANDRRFRLTPTSHWRVWRPRRRWLATLNAIARHAKA